MERKVYILHALSPLHAGTGHAADVIDLPIARMAATGIPIVPGSSVKGVLRDARSTSDPSDNRHDEKWRAVFGPDQNAAADNAGALAVGDARLLALPVRSFRGTFAWVTSPLLLRLASRDLGLIEWSEPIPAPETPQALAREGNVIMHGSGDAARLYLQDLDIPARIDEASLKPWCDLLVPLVCGRAPGDDILSKRLAVVDDETMTFLWETATQLDQRVRIDQATGTVAKGALWLEESLPPETLLIGLLEADKSRRKDGKGEPVTMQPGKVMEFALRGVDRVQFGGKATVGRGRCRLHGIGKRAPQ